MNTTSETATHPLLLANLTTHLALCQEVFALVTAETEALQSPDPFPGPAFAHRRNALLPRLTQSLQSLSRCRTAWAALPAATRARCPEADSLMQRNQELIMRIVVLDRENEQTLLRRGLLSPGSLPPSRRQHPQLVARCYRPNLPA
jgi:hypothetical protein